ncbi:MAG: hypothetical protein ACYT04_38500 [Nostoc sp.]
MRSLLQKHLFWLGYLSVQAKMKLAIALGYEKFFRYGYFGADPGSSK